jgi:hypothetical protein
MLSGSLFRGNGGGNIGKHPRPCNRFFEKVLEEIRPLLPTAKKDSLPTFCNGLSQFGIAFHRFGRSDPRCREELGGSSFPFRTAIGDLATIQLKPRMDTDKHGYQKVFGTDSDAYSGSLSGNSPAEHGIWFINPCLSVSIRG